MPGLYKINPYSFNTNLYNDYVLYICSDFQVNS